MKMICLNVLLVTVLMTTACSTESINENPGQVIRILPPVDIVGEVLRGDKRGIRTRSDAIKFYINKGVSLYFDSDMRLTSFDCSRPGGLTDDDMKYIVFFPEAGAVHLSDKELTDKIFYYFQILNKITALSLYNTSVTGEGFRYLADKQDLIILDFGGSPITDTGISFISRINFSDNVIILNLKGSKITDEGMKYIEKIRIGKGRINLRHTSVTDDGIRRLAGFKDLVEVDLLYTSVTDSGGNWLKKKLPNANITWGELKPDAADE